MEHTKTNFLCLDEIRFFRTNASFTVVIFLTFFIICTPGVLEEYDQLILSDLGLSLSMIGLWEAFSGTLKEVGSILAPRIKRMQSIPSLILYALYYFLMAVCGILAEEYLQQKIDQEGRSTVHSLVSLLLNLLGMVAFLILGALFRWFSLFGGLFVTAIFMVFTIFAFYELYQLAEKRTQNRI